MYVNGFVLAVPAANNFSLGVPKPNTAKTCALLLA